MLQLAKTRGSRIAATVDSAESAALASSLGADEPIIFLEEKVEHYVDRLTARRGFDVVFDTVGGANLPTSFMAASENGRITTTNARTTQDLSLLHAKALSFNAIFILLPLLRGSGRDRHGRILRSVSRLADAGQIHPLLDDSYFTLATAADAHRRLESGKAKGKVVVDVAADS